MKTPTKTKVKLKAIIRYNKGDKAQVVYYRQGKRFFKLVNGKRSVALSAVTPSAFYMNFVTAWAKSTPVSFVYPDEQVLFKGVPVRIQMDVFDTIHDGLNVVQP